MSYYIEIIGSKDPSVQLAASKQSTKVLVWWFIKWN